MMKMVLTKQETMMINRAEARSGEEGDNRPKTNKTKGEKKIML